MPDIDLPEPGEDPNWAPKLNTAITVISDAVDSLPGPGEVILATEKGATNGVATLISGKVPESQVPTRLGVTALSSMIATLVNWAKSPDLLITGAITRNGDDVITTAAVKWPDGSPGTFTTDTIDASGAINAYHITYGSPASKTFTQPAMTRNANGAVTALPAIVVS